MAETQPAMAAHAGRAHEARNSCRISGHSVRLMQPLLRKVSATQPETGWWRPTNHIPEYNTLQKLNA